jgi:predicted DNA-binding transcriptional regulator YafY
MRRADRLFQIVQHLRGGRLVTAKMLSDRLEVSERTIYRDIADLQSTGVPVDGEAGVGYILREGFDLPPLMFTQDEIVALVAGARMARAFGGAAMARAAEEALIKIGAVLPPALQARLKAVEVHAPGILLSEPERQMVDFLETAVAGKITIALEYGDVQNQITARNVRPLGLWFWGRVWTFVAWCELRNDFRAFRIDRIHNATDSGNTFKLERGKTLRDFYRQLECREGVTESQMNLS